MQSERLKQLILAAPRQRLLCLGDVMLDDYVHGEVTRISPEAPVPVLARTHSEQMPGGAANTARNLAALGAPTQLVSMVGNDPTGRTLRTLLDHTENIDTHLLIDPDRTTTRKTRLVSNGQQLLRVDEDSSQEISPAAAAAMLEAIAKAVNGASTILVSDYAKGVVSPDMISAVLGAAHDANVPVIIDPKGRDIARYGPVDLIKPNAAELSVMVELPTRTDREIEIALDAALDLCAAKAILVTRASRGLSYLERGGDVRHLSGVARDVYDVSGAGDTTLAALGLALSAGARLQEAAELALLASGIAVGKPGTAVVTPAEILSQTAEAALEPGQMRARVAAWREAGHTIGFTNGCFDILHPGHLRVLEEAKARCGRLIVGLNSDPSVRRLKGSERPINSETARARLLSGLSAVDGVIIFEEDTPLALIDWLQPDLLVKGGDYTEETIVGADLVRERGGKVHIVDLLEGHSTTAMITRTKLDDE